VDYTTIPLQDTQALIQWLNDLYPERCPNPDHSEREIWMKAGERRVVRHLINKLNRAEDKVLKGE
jgi:hypothetical protein